MVLLQRRVSVSPTINAALCDDYQHNEVSVAYGDGGASPGKPLFSPSQQKSIISPRWNSAPPLLSPSQQRSVNSPRGNSAPRISLSPYKSPRKSSPLRLFDNDISLSTKSSGSSTRSVLKFVSALTGILALLKISGYSQYSTTITDFESHVQVASENIRDMQEEIQSVREASLLEGQWIIELKEARGALEKEAIITADIITSISNNETNHSEILNSEAVTKWRDQRRSSLVDKIKSLQEYLRETSRRRVLEKYGEGPHRVNITYDQLHESGKTIQRSFVAELASIDDMPVSVNYFLELTTNKIFDDTIFLHHENTEHVIVSAPIDFQSQQIRHNEIEKLGTRSLGFPEYSEKFPHKKYTIGFAGDGPTFYINTMDNSEHHGPEGDKKHLLPGEADPCFATIVAGFDAVEDMIEYGLYQYRTKNDGAHPWANEQHAMTHLIKVEIIDKANYKNLLNGKMMEKTG